MRLTFVFAILMLAGCSGGDEGTIEASGTIEGTHVTIGPEVAGRVRGVLVQEGDRVRPGDTLLVLDDTEYVLQLRQAEANLLAADAQLRLALEGSRREDIRQAEAALSSAEKDYERMKDLLAGQAVTQKQFDDAEARWIAARETRDKLVTGLRKDEVMAVRARRDQAAAQADQLRKKVRDCRLLAPSEGIVTLRSVEPGEFVLPGAGLLRLTRLDPAKLTIYVGEADLGTIALGRRAIVTSDTKGGSPHEGRVVYISPVAEFTPKNVQTRDDRTKLVFAVRIDIPNPDGVLKPGMPADARLPAAEGGE